VAERFAAIRGFLKEHGDDMDQTVRTIIGGAERISAADAFDGMYRLEELKARCEDEWRTFDVMLLPTTGTIYRIDEVRADPVRLNSNLGYYTNFVNLLDLAAVAVPGGFRSNGLPFGVSFIGRAHSDEALMSFAGRFLGEPAVSAGPPPGCVEVAVVGAHLTGQPLNHQLTSRGARLMRSCRTAREYRLYALANTTPPKPGLVREPGFAGQGIELEVWAVPSTCFGSFVAEIPPPLGIGSVVLEDGRTVKCFICESYAIAGARDITSHGGWRAYLAASASAAT
jgi:allophanate hydrolase